MNEKYTIISYYKFTRIKNIFKYKNFLSKLIKALDVKGIILLAPECINVSISLLSEQKKSFIDQLNNLFNIQNEDIKISYANKHIFRKMKIKIKTEILTTRLSKDIMVENMVGKYIKPEDWDNFINSNDVILIDTRNNYEVEVGSFKRSINPECNNFTDILKWIDKNIINKNEIKKKKIAMYCTGGIRCEKATSYIRKKGINEIYHLEGGILKYLEKNIENNSWNGECFVFDNRVAVNKHLKKGSYNLCFACRMPLSKSDMKNKSYLKGVSCPKCHGKKTITQLNKYKTRHNQFLKRGIK